MSNSDTYTGKEVANHIKYITPDHSDIPDYFIKKFIEPNDGWIIKSIDLNQLLNNDLSFAEYYYSNDERYHPDDVTDWSLNHELVVYKDELLDGYSRASEMLRRGYDRADAFVLY